MKQVFSEAFGIFLEGLTPATLIAGFLMAFLGMLFRLVIGATNRNPESPRTPYMFKWSFLISDNAIRIYKNVAAVLIAIFLSLRFADKFIGQTLGDKFTMFYAFALGFGIDFVIERWQAVRQTLKRFFSSKKINDEI